jgi:hypothetical protein
MKIRDDIKFETFFFLTLLFPVFQLKEFLRFAFLDFIFGFHYKDILGFVL